MSDEKPKIVIKLLPKLEINQSENEKTHKKEWWWKIKSANGNIIAASTEGYINRQDCVDNILATENAIKRLREKDLIE